jgi:predicted HTH transcriptional regulator
MDGALPLTVTTIDDGQHVVHLPLPEKTCIASGILNSDDGMVETIITFRFANRQARYLVIGVSDDQRTLVGRLIQESEHRLPPPITPDPKTMGK